MDTRTFARAARIPFDRAEEWVMPITAAMLSHEIDTPLRQAAFIAQTAHESAHFTAVVEDLTYRSVHRLSVAFERFRGFEGEALAVNYINNPRALGNFVYANRLGNGDVESGDGFRFRGRGLIMITGRDNYAAASEGVGFDLIEQPELVEEPEMACLTSAFWWKSHGCNEFADDGAIDRITRVINGRAMLGRLDRANHFAKAIRVLDIA